MKKYLSFFICFILSFPLVAQVQKGEYPSVVKKIWQKESETYPDYIQFSASKRLVPENVTEFIKELLKFPDELACIETDHTTDRLGIQHTRMQILYQGIPVEGSVMILHTENGRIQSVNAHIPEIKIADIHPAVTAKQAVLDAHDHAGGNRFYHEMEDEPELVILPLNGKYHLAYRVDVFSAIPMSRYYVYVDAQSASILKRINRIHEEEAEGIAETKYQGTQTIITEWTDNLYRLSAYSDGVQLNTLNMHTGIDYSGADDYTDADNYWDSQTDMEDAATNAHFAIQKTLDFYLQHFGRQSYDGHGAEIISYVHYGNNYSNAFWNGSSFTYGDGDGINYTALTPLDVVAHEFTHAVTEHSAGLVYENESGALNESFSDIFAVAVDFAIQPASANYSLGEQCSLLGQPFRDMSDPKSLEAPDTYLGEYWVTGSEDNGGVHTNSGVQNHWFYLLAEGGSGINDLGESYSVQGIGIEKATEIAYRNLTVYLTPYAGYVDARYYAIQSAIDLYGECSPEVTAVTSAWHAVGVGESFAGEVVADFRVSRNYSAETPMEVSFINASLNAGNFTWQFGDGTSSSEMNPVHSYSGVDRYTVQLVAEGVNNCAGSDTITRVDFIVVDSADNMGSAVCPVLSLNPGEVGIASFRMKTLHHTSGLANEEGGYVDNSGHFLVELMAGERVVVEVTTGAWTTETVTLWIDLDSDGLFSSDEKLWISENRLRTHQGSVIIPAPSVYDQPLRMRIISDIAENLQEDACAELQYGQAEDYRVVIRENFQLPKADFSVSDSVVGVDEVVHFRDRSENLPSEWYWEITGAIPPVSEIQDPEAVYSLPGTYPVSLSVRNAYGADSLYNPSFLEVLPSATLGVNAEATFESGLLYDAGGPEGNYTNDEKFGFLIRPACAKSIHIRFYRFKLEKDYDYLYVYNGPDDQGELLLEATGNALPDEIIVPSGMAYIVFESDFSTMQEGFKMRWDAEFPPNVPLTADFMVSDTLPAYIEDVQFTDLSSHEPVEWFWNFGDGCYSAERNPRHRFTTSGNKEILLYASNCYFSDTLVKTITVLPPPEIRVNPTGYNEQLHAGEVKDFNLEVSNLSESGVLQHSIRIREHTEKIGWTKTEYFTTDHTIEKDKDNSDYLGADTSSYHSFRRPQELKVASSDYSQSELEKVMEMFAGEYEQISRHIPACYYFDEGEEGSVITDGGDDMFDGGNYLSTNFESGIAYSNDSVQSGGAFGTSGSYFTSKKPGIFLLAADLDQVSEFSLSGNLGADGEGRVDASIFMMERGMQHYTGFVKRVYGTTDPSVNHLIIVPGNSPELYHSIDPNSNSDGHIVGNLEASQRIYYLLIASSSGTYIPDTTMAGIMSEFLAVAEPGCSWINVSSAIVSTEILEKTIRHLTVNTSELIPGHYTADIHVLSNDTCHSELIIPFDLEVQDQSEVQPPVPGVVRDTTEIVLILGGTPVEILLDTLFIDTTANGLNYQLVYSEDDKLDYQLEERILVLEPLAAGRTEMEILATNSYGQTAVASLFVVINDPVSQESLLQDLQVTAFPNPAGECVMITGIPSCVDRRIYRIIDMKGRIVQSGYTETGMDGQSLRFDISGLSPGLYTIHLEQEGRSYHVRILKQ